MNHQSGELPLYQHISQNEFVTRKHTKQNEEDIAVCECIYDPANGDCACGETCLNVLTSTECTPGHCPCGVFCKNQKFQKCEYAKTRFFKTEGRGWGLLADENIQAGQFVIEYCGEVITWTEARRRSHAYELQGIKDAYIICLNASECIDATAKGSHARFINHSCQPNCETRKWNVLGEIRVGVFAKQDIPAGTELGYNYNFEWYGGAKVRCLCGSPNCSGFLGAKSRGFQDSTSKKERRIFHRKRRMENREEENPLLVSSPFHSESSECESLISKTWTESKKLWGVAGPSIFCRLALFSMTVVTQAFAGHLGDLNLAAISITTTVIISISFGFLLGMASALETLCGQAYGAKQYQMLGIYMQRSWIVLFISSTFLIPMFVFASPILKIIGQPASVADQTGKFAIWMIPFHLSCPFQFSLQRFLQSQLKTAVIAWVSGGAFLIHVIVSWVFVYNLRVGVAGTALTLGFSWWISVLGMFGYTVSGGCPLCWNGFSSQALVGLSDFFKLSVASGVMLWLENFYYRVLIIISGYTQDTGVALDALSICITIYGWESMISLGFLAATGVRVANELGAGNANCAKFATIVSLLYSVLIGFSFWLIIIAIPEKLAMIFTSSSAVISMTDDLALLLAFTILLNCIQPVLSGVAVGSGQQGIVALLNVGSYYVVGVPLGVILGWFLRFSITGIWAGMIGGTVVQTLILSFMIIRFKWEKEVQKAQIQIHSSASD